MILVTTFFVAAALGQEPKLKFQGGLWSGTNGEMTVAGVQTIKPSVAFRVSKKAELETGLMLVPGLILDQDGRRFGLSIGGASMLRKNTWKLKPIAGVVFVIKNDIWYALPGIGLTF